MQRFSASTRSRVRALIALVLAGVGLAAVLVGYKQYAQQGGIALLGRVACTPADAAIANSSQSSIAGQSNSRVHISGVTEPEAVTFHQRTLQCEASAQARAQHREAAAAHGMAHRADCMMPRTVGTAMHAHDAARVCRGGQHSVFAESASHGRAAMQATPGFRK
jgi:hypothetical protein